MQNGFNQVFVDAVRATGGNNATRHLVVQGFNTNIEHTLKWAVLPRDTVDGRLMMEVHYYDPFDFTLNEKSKVWQWGSIAKDPAATQTVGRRALGRSEVPQHARPLRRPRRAGASSASTAPMRSRRSPG